VERVVFWRQGVSEMLTVAAREVLARAATVAKVKAFILNVGGVVFGLFVDVWGGGWIPKEEVE